MFVGRKEYLDFFEDGRCKIKEECERQLVIQFDGKSGIGKSVLLNELERSFINSKKNNYILINLTEDYINKNSKDILQGMRNQLVNKMDFKFWRYDLAMMQYAYLTGTSLFCSDCTKGNKTGISKWIEEHHLNPLVTEAVDLLLQANNTVYSITNIATKVIQLAKDTKDERFLKAIKDSMELDNKTEYEIKGKLYEYFGRDLEDNLNNNKDFPLTIFIDAYEEMNTDSQQNNTEWLMGAQGIIKYTQNHDVTWVIAGKEKCIIHKNVILKQYYDNEKDFDKKSVREQSYTLGPLKKQEIEEILKSEEISAVFYEEIYNNYLKKPEYLSEVLHRAEIAKELEIPFNMNIEDKDKKAPICKNKLDCTNLLYQLAYLGRWNNDFIKDIIDNFSQDEYDKLKKSEKKYFKDILGGKESIFNEELRERISTKYIKSEKNRKEIETLKQNFQKKYLPILENIKVNEEYISAIITLVQFYGNHKEIVCPIDKLMDGISMLIEEDEIESALYSINKLNGSYYDIQKFHDVKIMLYEKEKEVLGESNPITIRIKDELTRDEEFVGRSEKEYVSRKKKYQKLKEDLGEDNLETISYSEIFVNSFFHLKRFEDAYELRKKIYGQLKAMLGENHTKTIECKSLMVHLLEDLKRYEKACELAQEIYEQRKVIQGENDIETIKSKENWALALKRNGDCEIDDETRQKVYEKVYQMHMEIYNQRKKILGETHKDTRTSIYFMGSCLIDLRRYEEACEMRKKQYEILLEVEGKDARDTIICKRNLLYQLRNIGRNEEAKALEMS